MTPCKILGEPRVSRMEHPGNNGSSLEAGIPNNKS